MTVTMGSKLGNSKMHISKSRNCKKFNFAIDEEEPLVKNIQMDATNSYVGV